MPIIFKPTGSLDVATDQAQLPETVEKGLITSGAMARCKNLRLDRTGIIPTRYGSRKLNASAISSVVRIIEQAGVRYAFGGLAIYRDETLIKSGLAGDQWSGIVYNPYNSTTQSIYAVNGADRKRIEGSTVHEWGIEAPTAAPTIAAGAGTGLTGAFNYRYSYCRKEGSTVVSESNASDEADAAVTLADQNMTISWTPSADPQVTHVRLYRTLAGGTTYYHDKDVAIGTATTTSNTSDAALGNEDPSDHDRPPAGTFVFGPTFNGVCFMLYNNNLYFSKPKQPDYWPITYFIEVSQVQYPLQAGCVWNGQPYVLDKREIYQIQGTGADSFFPYAMRALTGAQGANCVESVAGMGIFHVGTDGLYLFNNGADRKLTQSRFEPVFRGETVNGVPGATDLSTSWVKQFRNQLYFGYTSYGYTYPTNVLVWNWDSERTTYYSYPYQISCVEVDNQNDWLLGGTTGGYIFRLEDPTAVDDDGTAISWEIESKVFTLPTRRHFPRWAKYDVDASDADSAAGEIILDGAVHQSHTLSEDRNIRKRLISTGNGRRASIRISGEGSVEIFQVEAE